MITWKRSLVLAAALLAGALLVAACTTDNGTGLPVDTHTLTVLLDGIGSGAVTSDPAGIDCDDSGTACAADFDEGTQVTLAATPADGMAFLAWSGAVTGTAAAAAVTMDADRSVTAEFDDPDMAVQEVGADGGTVTARDSGITLVIPAGALSVATAITIERIDPAELGEEWESVRDQLEFAYDLRPDGLTFDAPVTVELPARPLERSGDTVSAAIQRLSTAGETADEALDSLGVELNLSDDVSTVRGTLRHFSPLTVHAKDHVNDGETRFSVTDIPDEVPLGAEFTVFVGIDAAFESYDTGFHVRPPISVVSHQPGVFGGIELTFRCDQPGGIVLDLVVFLTDHVSGESLNAWFWKLIDCVGHTLDVALTGSGSGTVTSTPEGIVCGSGGTACTAHYPLLADVSLIANPDAGSTFESCSGGGAVENDAGDGCTVTMDADKAVEVAFGIAPEYELSVTLGGDGDGTVISTPAGIDCTKAGEEITGSCTATGSGTWSLVGEAPDGSLLIDWGGAGTTDESGARDVTLDEPKSVSLNIPSAPDLATFVALQSVAYLEAIMLMPYLFPFLSPDAGMMVAAEAGPAGPACPTVLGAADGGAYAFDACTGEILQEYPYAGDAFYDAIALVPPEGSDALHQLLLAGQNWVYCFIEGDGAIESCVGIFGGANIPDAQLIARDPRAGAVMVDGDAGMISFILFDPDRGWFEAHPERIASGYHLEGVVTSAVAGGAPTAAFTPPDEALVVTWERVENVRGGRLHHVDMHNESADVEVEATLVGDLAGADPRRIRCDLDSGICAVSDFTGDLVTIVLWDGTGMPTIAGTTGPGEIADGPVGLDVFGNRVVTAGFNDDHFSVIEVDAAGAILSTTTTPLPAGCTQPGHAMFLRDGGNTIVVSCWGGDGIAYIPNAF